MNPSDNKQIPNNQVSAAKTPLKTLVVADFQPITPSDLSSSAIAKPQSAIICLDGLIAGAPAEWPLENDGKINEWFVGRDPLASSPNLTPQSTTLCLPDVPETKTVSRLHAVIRRETEDQWKLENSSPNGAMINNDPLPIRQSRRIEAGDRLMLGGFVIYFREGSARPKYPPGAFSSDLTPLPIKPEQAHSASPSGQLLPFAGREKPSPKSTDQPPPLPQPASSVTPFEPSAAEPGVWGWLVESTLKNPRRFPLTQRLHKIGKHPYQCDIVIEDVGVSDMHAVLQWRGQALRCISKAHETPVQVNHKPVRTSGALTDGTLLKFANTQFQLNIQGAPPPAISPRDGQILRRTAMFVGISLIVLGGTGIWFEQSLSPRPPVLKLAAQPSSEEIIQDVLENHGFEGFNVVYSMSEPPSSETLARMQKLQDAQRMLHKTTDEAFRRDLGSFQQSMMEAVGDSGWQKRPWVQDIVKAFDERRNIVANQDWKSVEGAVSENNLDDARKGLGKLRDASPLNADEATEALAILGKWETMSRKAPELTPERIVETSRERAKQNKGMDYLQAERKELAEIRDILDRQSQSANRIAKTLIRTDWWTAFNAKAAIAEQMTALLSAYADGNAEAFTKIYGKLDPPLQTLAGPMASNLETWENWKSKKGQASDGKEMSADGASQGFLESLRQKCAFGLDRDAPLLKEIEKQVQMIGENRGNLAAQFSREAKGMEAGPEKLSKLLSALEYGAGEDVQKEVEETAVKWTGMLNEAGNERIRKEKEKLKALKKRFDALGNDNLTYLARQFDTLLRRVE